MRPDPTGPKCSLHSSEEPDVCLLGRSIPPFRVAAVIVVVVACLAPPNPCDWAGAGFKTINGDMRGRSCGIFIWNRSFAGFA
jgi:hypothetical protein